MRFFVCLLFGDRPGTSHPRGPLAPRQKGGRRPQAPRDQSQGQGLEVPLDSYRVAYSPPCAILQVQAADPSDLQVRLRYCFDTHRLRWIYRSRVGGLYVNLHICMTFQYVKTCSSLSDGIHSLCSLNKTADPVTAPYVNVLRELTFYHQL